MKRFDLRDGETITIEGEKVTSSDPLLEKMANSILKGSIGEFRSSEVYPCKENAIAFFLAKEMNLHKKMAKKDT